MIRIVEVVELEEINLPSGQCFQGFDYINAIVIKVYKFRRKEVTHSLDIGFRDLKTNLKVLLELSFVEEITSTRVMQSRCFVSTRTAALKILVIMVIM